MKAFFRFSVILAFASLVMAVSGCSKNSTKPEVETTLFEADGLWLGGFTFMENGQVKGVQSAFCMIAPDGRVYFLQPFLNGDDYSLLASGNLAQEESGGAGALTIYDSLGTPVGTLSISQGKTFETMIEGQTVYSLTAQFKGSAAPLLGEGELSLVRMDTMYNRPSSLTYLAGRWQLVEEGETTFLDIQASGSLSGGNTSGCQFEGRVEIIEATKNLYNIPTFTIAQCGSPWDGTYQGLAALIEDELILTLANQDDSFAFFIIFSR
ncbi:hypothetical protein ACX8XP_04040 [Calditrichota bacterium LG25]